MDQTELAHEMRSVLNSMLHSIAEKLTSPELEAAEKGMVVITNALEFKNPLAAIMECMVLVSSLSHVEDETVRAVAPEAANRLRKLAGYSA